MPRLKYPESWNFSFEMVSGTETVRRLDPDSPGPLFHLLDHSEIRLAIELYLDGREHCYAIEAHFDRQHVLKGETVTFLRGPSRMLEFDSSAADFKDFASDYYAAVREMIRHERQRQYFRKNYGKGGGS